MSKKLSNGGLVTLTELELKALLLLVREYVVGKTTLAIWAAYCCQNGMSRVSAELITKRLQERANEMEL